MNMLSQLFGCKKKTDWKELKDRGAIVIDVRSAAEFAAGHIPGSRNIPLQQLETSIKELEKLNKPLITVCRSGNRSEMARKVLSAAGLEVYNGGAWMSFEA
jgi:rhodanese-related sulfurtransferase